ncbi:MAG: sulfotransferase domain-containing protein [Saprospiraceae bacterium]|nr:sulfotransferase domain-containing protein [Saprospiraceae bacterium]
MEAIAIFGAPRSGTSWLGQIFNSHPEVAYRFQPLFSYAFKDRLNQHSTNKDIADFHRDLLETTDDFVLQKTNVSGAKNLFAFAKATPTHLVWKEVRYLNLIPNLIAQSETKIIGIVRHPGAVLNSWFKAPKEFDPSWDLLSEWEAADKKNKGREEEFYGYTKWKAAAFQFIKMKALFPERVHIVVYEDLHESPKEKIKELFSFCNLEYSQQTDIFLDKSSATESTDPYGVFRKNHNAYGWEDQLPSEIVQGILGDPEFRQLNKLFSWRS